MHDSFTFLVQDLPKWHPIQTYFKENQVLKKLLHELANTDPSLDFQLFFNVFNQVAQIDIRYTRKENQLFPYLEKYGWNGPSQGMWSFHDSNRDLIRSIRKMIEDKNFSSIKNHITLLIGELQRMMLVEEQHLLPYAFRLLQEEDWKSMQKGEDEIGYAFGVQPEDCDHQNNQAPTSPAKLSPFHGLKMDEGIMNLDQINLMLRFLPVDLTYVDEQDRVIFYNRGEERVFPRSPAVIGREVRFCHPPKSVGTVLKILEEFKKGTKDEAEFWIDYRGKKIHIRYFAIRDQQKNYRGVIEVSQDITNIQTLTGEQRLLSWEKV